MKKFLIILGLLLNTNSYADVNLCYFSLNNEKEYSVAKSFLQSINPYSSERISIKEYQPKGSNPKASFLKMAKSGDKCDGLIISGHHTGSFGGKRASGSLGIEQIEELSCNPETSGFFDNISAVWLQGCRTLGVSINADEYEDFEEDPDFHTNRLDDLLEEDHLDQSLEELNLEFSDVLDQDNPLSTRYLRAFQNAAIFGWTKTAPGVIAQSEKSIPYHIAHISRILNPEQLDFFRNPINLSSDISKKRYAKILVATLSRIRPGNYVLQNRISEQVLIDAWLEHGQAIGNFPYSFNNPDLMAYKSLTQNRPKLQKAKLLNCNLQAAITSPGVDNNNLVKALSQILLTKEMIFFNLNKIKMVLSRYENNIKTLTQIRHLISESQNFHEVLYQKLGNKELGISRRIEYYSIYTQVVGKRNHKFENRIKQSAFQLFTNGDGSEQNNIADYKIALFDTLYKNKIIDNKYKLKFLPYIKSTRIISDIITIVNPMLNIDFFNQFLTLFLDSQHFSYKVKMLLLDENFDNESNAFLKDHANVIMKFVNTHTQDDINLLESAYSLFHYSDYEHKSISALLASQLIETAAQSSTFFNSLPSNLKRNIRLATESISTKSHNIPNNQETLINIQKLASYSDKYDFKYYSNIFQLNQQLLYKTIDEIYSHERFIEMIKSKEDYYLYFFSSLLDSHFSTQEKLKKLSSISKWIIQNKDLDSTRKKECINSFLQVLSHLIYNNKEELIQSESLFGILLEDSYKGNIKYPNDVYKTIRNNAQYFFIHGTKTKVLADFINTILKDQSITLESKQEFINNFFLLMKFVDRKFTGFKEVLFWAVKNGEQNFPFYDNLLTVIKFSDMNTLDKKIILEKLLDKNDELYQLIDSQNTVDYEKLWHPAVNSLLEVAYSLDYTINEKKDIYNRITRYGQDPTFFIKFSSKKIILSSALKFSEKNTSTITEEYLSYQIDMPLYNLLNPNDQNDFYNDFFEQGSSKIPSTNAKRVLEAIQTNENISKIDSRKLLSHLMQAMPISDYNIFDFVFAIKKVSISNTQRYIYFDKLLSFLTKFSSKELHELARYDSITDQDIFLRAVFAKNICHANLEPNDKVSLLTKLIYLPSIRNTEFYDLKNEVNTCEELSSKPKITEALKNGFNLN